MSRTINDIRRDIERMLEDDEDAFVSLCESLDERTGILGDARCYPMDEFDDHFSGMGYLEVIDNLDSCFSSSDDFFYDNYGIGSTDDLASYYEDYVSMDDLIDEVAEGLANGNYFSMDSSLRDLFEELNHHDEFMEHEPVSVYMLKDCESTLMATFKNHAYADMFIEAWKNDRPEQYASASIAKDASIGSFE